MKAWLKKNVISVVIGVILLIVAMCILVYLASPVDRDPKKSPIAKEEQNPSSRGFPQHFAGEKIKISKDGYLYERIPGWTYYETTENHLIYVPNGTTDKYFKGPGGWESEYPNKGEIRALTRATDEIWVYQNPNYGESEFTLKIVSVSR